jgi:hypothetical protein
MAKPAAAVVVGLVLAAVGVLQMGIFPSYFWDMARQSVQAMLM